MLDLDDLRRRYGDIAKENHPFWGQHRTEINEANFRADDKYMAQMQAALGVTEKSYAVSATYADMVCPGLLERLGEDDAFGVQTVNVGGITVSRDLIDSVIELGFVDKVIGLDSDGEYTLLDIGAGYGRFAYRFCQTFPNSRIFCVDAIPESTYLCSKYLEYRGVADRAITVPLDTLNQLANTHFDLAVNIHSWSECTLAQVEYWLGKLADWRVPYLFLVPHNEQVLTVAPQGGLGPSFLPSLEKFVYQLIRRRWKYNGSPLAQGAGIYNAPYMLFERNGA